MTNDNALMIEAMNADHVGFCMSTYIEDKCFDCPSETECLEMYVKERNMGGNENEKMWNASWATTISIRDLQSCY